MDRDQQWLLNCLTATLDPNQDVRSFAEASLKEASSQPVLLKQFVKEHWQEDDPNYAHPLVPPMEKVTIRNLLLMALDDSHGKICTAASMAVASIAHYDWPEEWPELMPFLLKLISGQSNMHGVNGGLRCLALLSGDLDDSSVPRLVPLLFPHLYTIVSSHQIYNKHMRTKALSIVHSCISTLGSMTGVYKSETRELMVPMFKAWMEQFTYIMQAPVQSEDPDDWSIRMEVLKCLIQLIQSFRSLGEAEFVAVLRSTWQTFVSCLQVYELSSIRGTEDPCSGIVDSDGADTSLNSFVIQLFEFFLTVVGDRKLSKVVQGNIKELLYYAVAFLQITEEQVQTWVADANQYVADEDDMAYSCRISGLLLLEEIVKAYDDGIEAVLEAAQNRFTESFQAKASGSSNWWKLREAAIFSLGALAEMVVEPEVDESVKLRIGKCIEPMLIKDMGIGVQEFPFLHARIFSTIAKFSSVVGQETIEHFLFAAMKAIASEVPPPVKVGACRALSQLLQDSNYKTIQPHILDLFSAIVELLKQASDETMHLVLETLQAAVKAGNGAIVSVEPVISPLVLNLWAQRVSDPFISIDAVEVLEAIKDMPGCLQPLVSRVLPSIRPILRNPHQQPEGLVAGSLDLLTMLIKKAPSDVVKQAYDACFDLVVQITLQSEDHGEIQNATECLSAFVLGGKQDMLSWGPYPSFTIRRLLDSASRLLNPDLNSSASLFVGGYILQLILHLPSEMQQHLQNLVAALVKRMESSQISGLTNSILLVLARLVHLCAPHVGLFIDLLRGIPMNGYDSALSYVMSEWTRQQGEIQGSYQIKVTTTALALLLSSRHAELEKIFVQGQLIKSSAGIVTRSKAKTSPDQWTVVSLPVKILSILADMLLELQEQAVDKDEDSEWEEVQDLGDVDCKNLIYSTTSPSSVMPSIEQLEAMEKVLFESEDNEYEDCLLKGDPLNEINLTPYIVECIKNFSSSFRPDFDHFCQTLTEAQRNIVQTAIK
ncbi:unnamed protein product [Victoria cruziana]